MKLATTKGARLFALLCLAPTGCTYGSRVGFADGKDAGGMQAVPDSGPATLEDAWRPSAPPPIVGAHIDPSSATIDCSSTQQFHAYATRADGVDVEVPAVWSVDYRGLGRVTDGLFTPHAGCLASGTATITAQIVDTGGAPLSPTATVTITRTIDPVLVDVPSLDTATTAFADPVSTGSTTTLLYPLDGALMPNNVAPPDIQWSGGVAGDIYRVSLHNDTLDVVAYVAHTGAGFTYAWTPSTDLWDLVAENYGPGIHVQVDRWSSATHQVELGAPISIRLTRSGISGQVYYWSLPDATSSGNPGALSRVNAGTSIRETVIPNPPTPGGITACVGCHSISQDGRYMAATLGDGNPGAGTRVVFDLSEDLTTSPAPTVYTAPVVSDSFWFSVAFNPDGTRLIGGNGYARYTNALTGEVITGSGLPADSTNAAFYGYDWASDNSGVVAAWMNPSGRTWSHVSSAADIALFPVTGTDQFGAWTTLHRAADLASAPEGGNADSHPTFSPDAQFIAFQHGESTRCTAGPASQFGSFGNWASSALYVMSKDGSSVQRLENAVAGTGQHRDYWPTFSPFTSAEPDGHRYFWVAFSSARPYGNAQLGTVGAPVGRLQLWVTAIDASSDEFPEPLASDPSHVPYRLPGQDRQFQSLAAHWAPLACRGAGESCTISSQCCSGDCEQDVSTGDFTCVSPPPDHCHLEYQSCSTNDDCCAGFGYECQGNACLPVII